MNTRIFILLLIGVSSCAKKTDQGPTTPPPTTNPPSSKLFGGTAKDELHSIVKSADGGYVVAGKSSSNDGDLVGAKGGNTDVWVTKFDQNNNIVWRRTYGGFDADGASAIVAASDGGYFVAGFEINGGDSVNNDHGLGDGWVLKLDPSGNKVWDKAIGGSGEDVLTSAVQTSDAGFVVAGYSLSNDGDAIGNHGTYDGWVVRLTKDGVIVWKKEYGGTDADYFHSVAAAADGGFVLAGESLSSNGDVTDHHGGKDGWLVKVDQDGNFLWQKSFGGSDYDIIYSIIPSDNDFVAAGVTNSNDGDISGARGVGDGWLIRINTSGTVLWQKTYGSVMDDQFFAIGSATANGFVITGISRGTGGDVGNNRGYYDEWIVRTDNNGTVKWKQTIGGTNDDFGSAVIFISTTQIRSVGYTNSNSNDLTGLHGDVDGYISSIEDQ